MFPIRDDNPHFLTPLVTLALIGTNALAWFGAPSLLLLVATRGPDPQLATRALTDLGLVPKITKDPASAEGARS